MADIKEDLPDDAYFIDFGAEKKKGDSKLSSAQFWGEKVMLSWAQLEYNHGLALKKWAETQKCQLRFSEEGCPDVLQNALKTLISFAEKKAAVLMKFSNQVEEFRGIRNILVSFETRDYRPTMERLGKEMRNLVTSHKIKEAQAKRERKKQKESMKKMQDREKSVIDGAYDGEDGDSINTGQPSEGQLTNSQERCSTMLIETLHRREFLKHSNHLHEIWRKKQKERLCLLLTCIQGFAKKIKTSDLESTKDTPLKQIKSLIREADVNTIVKELDGQYTKVYLCQEQTDDRDEVSECSTNHQLSTLSRTTQDGLSGNHQSYIPPKKTVTLPDVETFSNPESFPKPAIYRKLDNSFKLIPPSFQFRPRLPDKSTEAHSYANCDGNRKCISSCTKQRQLLTPTTVDITGLRPQPGENCHLAPIENTLQMGDYRGFQTEELIDKRLKPCLISRVPSDECSPRPSPSGTNSFTEYLAVGRQAKMSTLKVMRSQDGMKTPIARPSTPVDYQKLSNKLTAVSRSRKLAKLPKAPTPSSSSNSRSNSRDGSQVKPRQTCKVFLKVMATSKKDSVDQIVKKHYGGHRKVKVSHQPEKTTRTLVVVRTPTTGEDNN